MTGLWAQEAPPPQGKSTLVYIGTHTSDKAKGIYLFRLQSAGTEVFQNVTLVPLGLAAETANPTFFEIDAKRRLLFSRQRDRSVRRASPEARSARSRSTRRAS